MLAAPARIKRLAPARVLMRVLVVLATMTLPGAAARAAPPSAAGDPPVSTAPPDPACEATPSLEEARLITARDLHLRGEEAFSGGDYLAAVQAWTQVVVLMPGKAADLRVQLAHAHRRAYAADDDEDHLRVARGLFAGQLASLRPDDPAREDLEAEIGELEATLSALAQARARAQAAREAEIRQDQIRRDQQAVAAREARHQRRIQKIYVGAGGSLTGLGVGLLAGMTACLVEGAKLDREGRALNRTIGVSPGRYAELLAQGEVYNRAAVTTGVVGGMLALSGVSLLVVAAIRRERGLRPLAPHAALVPTLGGARLRF